MFIENKYLKYYNSLVEKARRRYAVGYVEKHHVIPRSLGGTDSIENVVLLTAREHYLAHLLLLKITTGQNRKKMAYALSFFNTVNPNLKRDRPKSRWYAYSRNLLSEVKKGIPPSEKCQTASNLATRGKKLSSDHRKKIGEALSKKISFFAVDPHGNEFSGNDLRSFCASNDLSFLTLRSLEKRKTIVLSSGRNKGWVFSICVIVNHDSVRSTHLKNASFNRSASALLNWKSKKSKNRDK